MENEGIKITCLICGKSKIKLVGNFGYSDEDGWVDNIIRSYKPTSEIMESSSFQTINVTDIKKLVLCCECKIGVFNYLVEDFHYEIVKKLWERE